jgi:hypothetical protein
MTEVSRRAITSTPVPGSALQIRASARRAFLAGGVAAAALVAGAAGANSAPAVSPDAELIRLCRQFAEAELTGWYRYVMAPNDVADEQAAAGMWVSDRATWDWIAATPATTPEGWQAKALAFAAWERDAFDDPADDRCHTSTGLASLLRDMVAPARAAIIARLAGLYGPLPDGYTADGMWLGSEARA